MEDNKIIDYNIKTHNKISSNYRKKHEKTIFTDIEQNRIAATLKFVLDLLKTSVKNPIALDYGCGTGNLTNHLLKLGFSVVSADISINFLKLLKNKYDSEHLETHLLNGKDLKEIDDSRFNLSAIYAVLHHVPDYLKVVSELVRVTKPGGYIYIDHEASPDYWNQNKNYIELQKNSHPPIKIDKKRFFKPRYYFQKIIKELRKTGKFNFLPIYHPLNPKYQAEGDIHVWPDDHIEWGKIKSKLLESKCDIIKEEDYLLFKSQYTSEQYDRYKKICNDYRIIIARKSL